MNKLEINLPIDQINGLERKLKHTALNISEDLEMLQEAKVEYYKDGVLVTEAIDNDANLTSSQKEQRKRMYLGVKYSSNTRSTMVDPQTGQEIVPGPSGYPDVPMVSELQFWQQLPPAFFTKANLDTISTAVVWHNGDTLAELVYNGLMFSMLKMSERDRV